MKKVFLSLAALALVFVSCSDEAKPGNDENIQGEVLNELGANSLARNCGSMEVLNEQLAKDPNLANKMAQIEIQYENFNKQVLAAKGKPGGGGGGTTPDNLGVINIPVVVHVLYNNSNENISDAQINSQIAVLNKDFRKTNSDVSNAPAEFAPLATDAEIEFTLAQVIRKATTKTSWGTNDAMKSSSQGGSDAVTPTTHLNIWVCNIGGGILGYAQFPGGSAATDGVVIGPNFFGDTGYLSAPFDEGRTATHEVGHWLNLRHIWGDGRCNRDDFVADTPSSDRANYGCPTYPVYHCKSNDMTMNYMDYVDDACMFMFTEGQRTRMRAIFAPGGARESFAN